MTPRICRITAILAVSGMLAACGTAGPRIGGLPPNSPPPEPERSTIWGLFRSTENPNQQVAVNRYLWNASLEVLDFLPVQSIDPFTGVIVTGYGTPPGGGRAYRATVKISDPALDARSLKVALQDSGGGAVAPGTVRAVEDAILTRARQLRVRDGRL
ncbi:DUF3576 domain-containing protein [uncultured Paracoccus sp.]|uniref:DUF3576 domain-containing protein n=1 Tax=uncultured Paracoccus sp. TaxID=189685 RepID=UPI00262282B6|nr:DUF3576 domain-containing protein [uncultured Paracoccus sp.]